MLPRIHLLSPFQFLVVPGKGLLFKPLHSGRFDLWRRAISKMKFFLAMCQRSKFGCRRRTEMELLINVLLRGLPPPQLPKITTECFITINGMSGIRSCTLLPR